MENKYSYWPIDTTDESLFELAERDGVADFNADDAAPQSRRAYIPLRVKFALSCLIALAWTALSVWLSLPWIEDLATVTGLAVAVLVITFIAYLPGFMNAFLLS